MTPGSPPPALAPAPVLHGDGVVLRAFADGDADLVRAASIDPFIPLVTTVPHDADQAAALAFVARQHERVRTGVGHSFVIVDRPSGWASGQIGLWRHDARHSRASIGYWVAAPFRGRGLARRALATVAAWGLGPEGFARVELYVEPWNVASWRTAESAGFTREGLLRSWESVGGERRDMYMYSRLPGDPPRETL